MKKHAWLNLALIVLVLDGASRLLQRWLMPWDAVR